MEAGKALVTSLIISSTFAFFFSTQCFGVIRMKEKCKYHGWMFFTGIKKSMCIAVLSFKRLFAHIVGQHWSSVGCSLVGWLLLFLNNPGNKKVHFARFFQHSSFWWENCNCALSVLQVQSTWPTCWRQNSFSLFQMTNLSKMSSLKYTFTLVLEIFSVW